MTCVLALVSGVSLALSTSPWRGTEPSSAQQAGPNEVLRTGERAADELRPNIVLISTDDMRKADLQWMPTTRRLVGQAGVSFTNMLSPNPLCCPARAEILTGQFSQNNGVRTNHGPWGGYHRLDTQHTLATWLTRAGYQTGFVGKHLNGYKESDGHDPGWTHFDPTLVGTYAYYGFSSYNDGDPVRHPGYTTDWIADRTGQLVTEFAGTRPFFVWASYVAPHSAPCGPNCWVPPYPARRHADLYPLATLPTEGKRSFDEPDVTDKPQQIAVGGVDRGYLVTLHRERIRTLAAVDEAVATTVRALRRAGELDETVIVFTSDNGFLLGEHRYHGKILPYEEALAVPLLVRGPGFPAGASSRQVVTIVDLAPTFLELADAKPDLTMDGRSLVPLLMDPESATVPGDTVLIQAGPRTRAEDHLGWLYRGVRTDRYSYTVWAADGFVELYDRRRDPEQLTNLGGLAAYAPVQAELHRRLLALQRCSGKDCHAQFGRLPRPVSRPDAPQATRILQSAGARVVSTDVALAE